MRRGGSLKVPDKKEGIRQSQSAGQQWTSKVNRFVNWRTISGVILLLCTLSLLLRMREEKLEHQTMSISIAALGDLRHPPADIRSAELARMGQQSKLVDVNKLWNSSPSWGWRASSAVRAVDWQPPPKESNGYLVVRCNGGLNQQRGAICNAVLAARIMNATLVLPELDTNSFWQDKSGFSGIYDVNHFIKSLTSDVKVVRKLPSTVVVRKKKRRLRPFQLRPPRDASPTWYKTEALAKMRVHGAVYLTPFSHRLAEELGNHEYQRLRCRVNFHALRFREEVMELSSNIVARLRSGGHFVAVHLRFEMDMLAFAGCMDIFTPKEQEILRMYRKENFAEKNLIYTERRLIGKCPLTPEEVGLILRSLGFDNSTRIYLASGDVFGGERFLQPLRALFPLLENRTTVATTKELKNVTWEGRGLLGPAVDYMVCLLSDIFMPTYDGPSNFANNLLGHRLYYGFRTTLQPNRKSLAPLFMSREKGLIGQGKFEEKVRDVILATGWFGGPHKRVSPESFFTNPWAECFCQPLAKNKANQCPVSALTDEEELLAQEGDDEQGTEDYVAENSKHSGADSGSLTKKADPHTKSSHSDIKHSGEAITVQDMAKSKLPHYSQVDFITLLDILYTIRTSLGQA